VVLDTCVNSLHEIIGDFSSGENKETIPDVNEKVSLFHYSSLHRWGPCPHSMARPRVADGGTASSYGGFFIFFFILIPNYICNLFNKIQQKV
jgi:hypothetical protein